MDYYLDSVAGNDSNSGHAEGSPWQSTAPLAAVTFAAGDTVYFKRGSSFDLAAATSGFGNEGISLSGSESGNASDPIVFTSYGTGPRPVLSNARTGSGNAVFTFRGGYVVVEGIEMTGAHYAGVVVEDTGHHVTVQDCETHHLGIGVVLFGTQCLVTRNIFRDGTMVVNTPGGDDDYGANGLVILGSHHEVSYNYAVRLIAPSMDYTIDGGFAEIYGAIDDVSIHHNVVHDSDGFSECATGGSGTLSNITYAYNESYNNGGFAVVHTTAGMFDNIRYVNNTIVDLAGTPAIFWFAATAPSGPFIYQNNIVVLDRGTLYQRGSAVTHSNNIFFTDATLGITLDGSDQNVDPLFVDVAGGDLHLTSSSPARDVGVSTLFSTDLDGTPVPSGVGVDLGAREYFVPGEDAGVVADAGIGDAGSLFDATVVSDAGEFDGGGSDAGTLVDAAIATDAMSESDAATGFDGGSTTSDAGAMAVDSGAGGSGVAPVSGCGCRVGAVPTSPGTSAVVSMILLALGVIARKRTRRL